MIRLPQSVLMFTIFGVLSVAVGRTSAQDAQDPLMIPPVALDTSPALRDIDPDTGATKRGPAFKKRRELPPIPRPRFAVTPRGPERPAASPRPLELQVRTFDGPGGADEIYPSDAIGAVGRDHYVAWVNTDLAVYRKDGKLLHGPIPGRTIWSDFRHAPCRKLNDGDPIVLYDQFADRWVLSQMAIADGPPFYQCLAVSTSPDPLGTYTRAAYRFEHLNDYGKLGVWSNAYLATFYMYTDLQNPQWMGTLVCAIDRTELIAGRGGAMVCADLPKDALGVMPVTVDGSQLPSRTAPGLFVGFGANRLELWDLSYDFAKPKEVKVSGPRAIPVAAFLQALDTIDQGKGKKKLDAVGDRLMYRVPLRMKGETATFVATHSVLADSGRVGVRWYEVDVAGEEAKVRQQGTFAPPDGKSRWLGSIASDRRGNVLLGYSAAGPDAPAALYLTGRTAKFSKGQMGVEVSLVTERKAQNGSDRWGDYAVVALDPVDDCTFWYIGQYTPSRPTDRWATRIATARFPDCKGQ
jgi:hypothetical protein